MMRATTAIFVLGLVTATAAMAMAQQLPNPPVLDMQRLYQIVGHLYDIDPELLQAIATAESNGDPSAVSPKGAEGLMQLMPKTARQYRVDHPMDPVENVLGAARFLSGLRAWSRLQAPYGEVDLPAMLAAYNAGPGAVEKYGGIPPYAETQAYVRKVLWLYLLGQPPPHRLNPMHTSGRKHYASSPPPSRPVMTERVEAKPAPRSARPESVFEQLAEIRRGRQRALSRETAAHSQTDSN